MDPFTTKLKNMRLMLEDVIFALQVAFLISVLIGFLLFVISLINLILDFKTKILEARKGIFKDFDMEVVNIQDGASFPGFLISNSIAGFIIVVSLSTATLTLLLWPMFWRFMWSYKLVVFSVIFPVLIKHFANEYIISQVYSKHYVKNRFAAGLIDFIFFYISMLGGLGSALSRFFVSFAGLLVC